ncbi:hypothetical protein ACHAWF_002254 [Thalassiosira exigua]
MTLHAMARHAAVHFGSPPQDEVHTWETTPVLFHGFEGIDSTRGSYVRSPEFECLGHRWCLKIYPGGDRETQEGMTSLFLENCSAESIEIESGFSAVDSKGLQVVNNIFVKTQFDPMNSGSVARGVQKFSKRSVIEGALINGSLLIEVRMRRTDPSPVDLPITSEGTFCRTMLKLFGNEESADVAFEVEDAGQEVDNKRKRARTTHTKLHAHRLILKQCAPDLDALCGSADGMVSVPIADVKPDIFRHMLFYVYGGRVTTDDLKLHAKELIEAADKYGVVNLKLEAEAWYVKTTEFTFDNVIELLHYADTKNCALLKEAAMDFMVDNQAEVLQKVQLKDAPEGLLAELFAALARRRADNGDGADLTRMRISDLRKKLLEKGLVVMVQGKR